MKLTSKLLISESPLQVIPSLAAEIGLNEAIVLQQIHYLSMAHDAVEIEGEMWVKRSLSELVDIFPFWCEKTLKNIFKKLKHEGLIITRKHGNAFDRCNYYTVVHEHLHHLSGETKTRKDEANNARSMGQDLPDQIGQSLPHQMGQDLPDVISFKSNKKNIRVIHENFAKDVVSVYHNTLPNHPKVRILSDKKIKSVMACASLKESFNDLGFWEVYFESIKSSEWHCGAGSTGWIANFDWLTNKDNFIRMYERACSL